MRFVFELFDVLICQWWIEADQESLGILRLSTAVPSPEKICRCQEGVVSEQIWKWYQKVHELAKSLVRRAFKASAPFFLEICLFWLWAA